MKLIQFPLLIAIIGSAAWAQEAPPVPVPIFGGSPVIGAACPQAPQNTGVPLMYLTNAGTLISCQGGFWAS